MFYLSTIITSLVLWIWFFYIKNAREYNGEPIKCPLWFYLLGLVLLFVPLLNFAIPFIFTLCMIFDEEVKIREWKTKKKKKNQEFIK